MKKLFLDIETTVTPHPEADGLLVVGFALDDEPVEVLDHADFSSGAGTERFLSLLADPKVAKVEHTLYDGRYMKLIGLHMDGPVYNTAVMAHTLNENTPLDIDWLSWKYAGLDMDKRLRRSAGHVYFRDDDDQEYDLNDWRAWSGWPFEFGVAEAWLHFIDYNVRDVDALRKLYYQLDERLRESEWDEPYYTERVPYTVTLLNMETRGLPIDIPAVEALAADYQVEHDRLAEELMVEGELPPSFNLNSGDQLCAYLFSRVVEFQDALVYDTWTIECLKDCMEGNHEDAGCESGGPGLGPWDDHVVNWLPEGFTIDKLGRDRVHGHWTVKGRGLKATPPTRNKVTGELGKRPSTASPELLYMHAADPWVRKLCLEYRKVEKLLTTYLTKWPVDAHEGRLYGRFNQTGTVTGRLSSSGPNLQNVPARGVRGKACRGLFRGHLVVADYDQLEMRLMAHFSQDAQMMRVFRDGRDPHLITAQGIFGDGIDPDGDERGIGKTLNFAMGYGAGPKKVAQVLSLAGYPTTKEVAEGYLAEMSRFYRGFFRWKKEVMAQAKRRGNVGTIGGGRRRLKANFRDTANWKLVGYGERQAVNAIIQGSAADIIRRAMVKMDAEVHDAWMLAQVHDELVFEYDPGFGVDLGTIQAIGERGHGFDLRVPLLFEPHAGETWAAAKAGPEMDLLFEEEEV
jgi:DNA polymerase I-like protein with 3'-5' exonuclease and polymerase domains